MKILEEVLPIRIWEEAESQAKRSTLKNFKTGAVIFSKKDYFIISRGCSHIPIGNHMKSIHAEYHALQSYINKPNNSGILIVCIGKAGNFAFSSRPCSACVEQIDRSGIETIYYAERMNDDTWICNAESPKELITRSNNSQKNYRNYAKEMRV